MSVAPPLNEPNPSTARAVSLLARDIKLSHSVFALPFALLGMVLAARSAGRWPRGGEVLLIVLCMVAARTFAMLVNRLADAALDAQNPRTQARALASGRVSRTQAGVLMLVSASAFTACCAGFASFYGNSWPLLLCPAVLAVLAFYSFAKRFTWLCHVLLGLALGISPVAAAVAIEPSFVTHSAVAWLIAAAVLCWVAGFDVIYALQDVTIDRQLGLFSMPATLGVEPALWVSRALHLGSLICFVTAWRISPSLGPLFLGAVCVTALLLVLEHALVWRSETRHIHHAFFTVNGFISVLLGGAGIVDALWN